MSSVKFYERLQELVFEKKITAEILANAVSIDLSMIYKYLRNEYTPSTVNAIKIASYFNCSLDYLLSRTDKDEFINKPSNVNFYIRFKKLLTDINISRYKFKKDTGFARQSIDDWYNGIRMPTIENLILIADYFDCSIDYIVGRSDIR